MEKNNPVRSSFFDKNSKKPQKMAVLFMKREFTVLKRRLLKTLKNSKKKTMISEVCCKNITIEEKPLWGTNGNLWFRANGLTFDCNIAIISCVTIVNKFVTIETAL